jgi:ATP-dependent protease HslVU (ClpYQ) ATPase subunit
MRNRWRRQRLGDDLRDGVTKNPDDRATECSKTGSTAVWQSLLMRPS